MISFPTLDSAKMPENTPGPTPSRGIYGLCLHLAMKSLFVCYVLWAVVPESWFEAIGFTYLPQRYWAIGLPIFLLDCFAIFAFIIYPSITLCMTPSFSDLRTITDSKACIPMNSAQLMEMHGKRAEKCICKGTDCEKEAFDKINKDDFLMNAVPAIYDLPITKVSEHLYL